MKNIAVFTSGGDAPGMNACIRAVVRTGISKDLNVYGIYRGYQGLIAGELEQLSARSVSNIIQRGGTILKTSRSQEFMAIEGQKKAAEILTAYNIDGLLAIGGDGTFQGLLELEKIWKGQIIGLPGTIDNDLYGTDFTIGFDTAVNTAVEAIDKIRDTADSHERYFIVEVMGRHAGFIALNTGLACGAEEILIPEVPTDLPKMAIRLQNDKKRGKKSCIIIVAEGDEAGNAMVIAEKLQQLTGQEYKVSILGYIQRGGMPSPDDRILASKLGAFAVDTFLQETTGVMVGQINGQLCLTPLKETIEKKKEIDQKILELTEFFRV